MSTEHIIDQEKLADEMVKCIMKGNLIGMQRCVDEGFVIDQDLVKKQNMTATEYALSIGNGRAFRALLNTGASVNLKPPHRNLFSECCIRNDLTSLRAVIRHGYKIDFTKEVHFDAFHSCSATNAKEIQKFLLNKGFAAYKSHPKMIESFINSVYETDRINTFLDKGFDINVSNFDGWTPLHFATILGMENSVVFLISQGADINTDQSKCSPLNAAVKKNNISMVKLLFTYGANVNAVNQGEFPLEVAINNEDYNMVEFLISADANVNQKTVNGDTALMLATGRKFTSIAELLIPHVTDFNAVNNLGDNALMYASIFNMHELFKKMIDKGADVNAVNLNGEKVITDLVKNKKTKLVDYLLQSHGHTIPIDHLEEALNDAKDLQILECVTSIEHFLLLRKSADAGTDELQTIPKQLTRIRI